MEAFKANGIAYLLKPYAEDDFEEAWEKFKLLFENKKNTLFESVITEILQTIGSENNFYKTIFSVKKRDGIYLLKTIDISYFQAQGDFVLAIDKNDRKHVLNDSLTSIGNQINPATFFRINRSEIVNKSVIIKYNQHIKNRVKITISEPKITLITSNSRTPEFREWVEL